MFNLPYYSAEHSLLKHMYIVVCSVTWWTTTSTQPHIMTQAYLTTVHSNSWDRPILSLSQLLPDTLSDLISDTRSALLRDSLRWEADKEEGSNSDQNHCCHLGSCLLCSHTTCYSLLEYSLCTVTRALNWQMDKLQFLLLGSLSEPTHYWVERRIFHAQLSESR